MAKEDEEKAKKEKEAQKAQKEKEVDVLAYGLSESEVEKRLKEFGPNKVLGKKENLLDLFLNNFQLPTIILLLSIIFWIWSGTEFVSAVMAFIFVLVLVLGDTFRDINVRNSIKQISERYIGNVLVIRGGTRRSVSVRDLVPGDVVILFPGMRIPADGIVLKGDCTVDESAFGHGQVEKKRKERMEEQKLPAFGAKEEEESKMEYFKLLAGSFILNTFDGEIIMKVEKTGKNTKLANSILKESTKKYLVIEKMEEVTDRLTNITLGIAFIIFVILMYYKTPFIISFSISAAAAVAGIPQSILLTARVAFSSSLKRIEGLAIHSDDLPERLSKITLICTEKIGALSMGQPTARKLWIDRDDIEVTGDGWSRAGKFKKVENYNSLDKLTESLIISTSAVAIYTDNREFYFTDPQEGALVTLAMKNNMSTETVRNENYCIERKTDPETGVVTSVHINPKKEKITYLRGSARKVAELCEFSYFKGKKEKINKAIRQEIEYKTIELAADGFTPYAIAYSTTEKDKTRYVLLGLIGIYDPPKPDVKKIVEETKEAGIKIVILTEEGGSTAVDFARQLGILTPDTRALICDQLKFLRAPERKETIKKTVVFASATPEYKKMIIDEFKGMGEKVLFIDSGTADMLSINAADVSMSLESATEESKYNADAIILNNNFYWVLKSIEESKALGNVVIRSFYSLFISDFTILFLILLVASLNAKSMNVLQILLVNFVADILIGVGLAMDRSKGSSLKSSLKFPSRGSFAFAVFMSVFSAIAIFLVANYMANAYFSSIVAAGIILCSVANAMNFSADESVFRTRFSNRILLAITAAIVFLLFITYVPMVNTAFGMLPLQPIHWGLLLMAAVSTILVMEIKKAVSK